MEDVQKLWIPSSQVYNVLLKLLTIGYGRSFHHQGDMTCHLHYCDGQPKVIRKHYMYVPMNKLSIDRTTSCMHTAFKVLKITHSVHRFLKDKLSS